MLFTINLINAKVIFRAISAQQKKKEKKKRNIEVNDVFLHNV